MNYTRPEVDQLEMLRHAHGGQWDFLTVGRVIGGTLWLARLHSNNMVVLRAHNAAELDRKVREWKPAPGEGQDR
ncbi:MAG TPA: hypothetical protein VGS19_29210 [Streptosporangiaceae bacterium]|nr:hypothetical protein [Streptosporangiaceae bacterium]